MPPLAGRIAGTGLAVAAVAIAVLAYLIHGDMARETALSREIQAVQDVKEGLDSLAEALHRLRFAGAVRPADGLARELVAVQADLEYLRAKSAEHPGMAAALAPLEPAVRHYADQAELLARSAMSPHERPALEEAEGEAFRAVRRADARATAIVNASTNAQIALWTGREVYVRALVAGAIALLIGLAVSFRNLQLRARRDAARIEQLAHYDSLTGLPNRSLLADRLDRLFASARRGPAPLAVLLFDLDGFKAVNDTRGHAAGDALLAAVAKRALDCVRTSDTVGRLGGDEFLVLLPDTDVDGAQAVAAKLLESMRQPFDLGGEAVRVSASIGGAFLPGTAEGPDGLVREADAALYASKRRGRDAYTPSSGPGAGEGG